MGAECISTDLARKGGTARADSAARGYVDPARGCYPRSCIREVAVRSPVDLYLSDLATSSQILHVDVPAINSLVAGWDLGRGEREVLTAALSQPGTGVVPDDSQARKCAKVMDIPLIGSIGLVARAKRANLMPLAKPAIEKLISVGLYIDQEIIDQVLRAVGEHPGH